MNDYVYEDLVKRDHGKLGILFAIFSYTAFAIFAFFFNVIPLFLYGNYIYITGMISFGIWYLIYRMNRNQKIDYEISITNDNFTVAKIIAEKKRIEEANFSIRETCEYIGPVTSSEAQKRLLDADRIVNATALSPYEDSESNWCCYYVQNSVKTLLVFNFVPSMYNNFRRYNPRVVAKYELPEGWEE